jgi:multidrug efflux pump subunit AcrA (membrane-fusion protein)
MPDTGPEDSKFEVRTQDSTRLGNSMEKMMEEKDTMKHSTREATVETEPLLGAGEHAQVAQIAIDAKGKLGRGPVIIASLMAVLLVIFIARGIYGRHLAQAVLAHNTAQAAIDEVAVTTPSGGANDQELKLPADTQGYMDTPVYSRTSGYLKGWYADIGTSVRKGQLLAIVASPEVDEQVKQAQNEVKTAQANEQLAEITAIRWKKLMAKDAVSQQETDQATSNLTAQRSTLNSAEANLHRLQQMRGFERIYAPFDGVITARNVDVGALIQANSSIYLRLIVFVILSRCRRFMRASFAMESS